MLSPAVVDRLCTPLSPSRRREGPIGFYRGYSANLLRVVPASAITLTAYEAFRPMFATMLGEAHRA